MKKPVHWVAATIIVLLSGTALSAWIWISLRLETQEYFLLLVLVCLPLAAVLGAHVAPQQMARVKSLLHRIRGTVKCTQWRLGTVGCTILLILTSGIWARSLYFVDSIGVTLSPGRDFRISSFLGRCSVGTQVDSHQLRAKGIHWDSRTVYQYLARKKQISRRIRSQKAGPVRRWPGFELHKWFAWNRGTVTGRGWTVGGTSATFPIVIPLVLFAIAPAAALWRGYRTHRRSESVRCTQCGYNLTGNPSGRCPECGHEIGVDAGEF